jgi:hypothetical protein
LEKILGQSGDHTKDLNETRGNSGNSGNIDSIDRLVDSDFDSKESVPTSVPTDQKSGNKSKECELEPAKIDNSEKIHAASIVEYGLCGWVDPRKIANALKLQFGEVVAWLDANYYKYARPDGTIGYTQRPLEVSA